MPNFCHRPLAATSLGAVQALDTAVLGTFLREVIALNDEAARRAQRVIRD
jgi:xylulose-5-phosphate/fructose-6-phosphate phosphoketolase